MTVTIDFEELEKNVDMYMDMAANGEDIYITKNDEDYVRFSSAKTDDAE